MITHKDLEHTNLPQKEIYFQGKEVVITGGASGIGKAIAERLSQLGAHVSVIDITDSQLPEKVNLIQANVTDQSILRRQISLEKVDLLIIAAGVTSETNDPTPKEQELMEAVNVLGVENTLEVFEPLLSKNAQVVYIGTDNPPKEYYAKTKKQGAQLVKEFTEKHTDLTTRIIYLGPVRTPLFEKGKSLEVIQRIENNVGLYEPSEFAEELINDLLTQSKSKRGLQEKVMYKNW